MQNIQIISVKYLRDNLAEILERCAIGKESFLVCKFGKPKAIFTPPDSKKAVKNKRKKF